ncbi:MAG: hypothetical protein SOV85_14415 [Clostridium sp.]|uniref:hypothetical protein n=1 Tax=Clostridium sp. TaxID=1506 RepID=UPI002A74CAFA|nr:hypothetical protein [Clostridium sp.]MDY2632524.1 hypothetical protein [Clostridium sp.]
MKKLIASTLLFTMLSTNIAEAMPNDSTLTNMDVTQSMTNNIVTTQTVNVNNFNDLKQYKDTSDITIEISGNITLDEKIEMTGSNVVINGNGFEIDINENKTKLENKFVIKRGNNVSINNISIKNYITSGILLYEANNVSMSDIKLIGNTTSVADDKSKVGIDLHKSTATLEKIKSENHRYSGIRLRNQSGITLKGGNIHINDVSDLESQVVDGAAGNDIIDDNNIYTEWSKKESTNNNTNVTTRSTIYKVKTIATANNLDEFKAAIKIPNSIITLTNNITLDGNIEINQKNIIIKGNSNEISLGNKFSLTVKAASNVKIDDVTIKDYKGTGLTVYTCDNVELNNIHLIGKDASVPKEERSTVGLDIYNSTVKLSNIETKNHLYRGIQVRKESTVDILTVNIHNNDSVHMQNIIASGENPSAINDSSNVYLPGNKYSEGKDEKIDYYSQKNITINSVTDLKNNIKNSGNVLTLNSDIKVEKIDLEQGKDAIEFELASSVVINGNGRTIDLNNLGSITLKGKDIRLINVNVKNSKGHSINIYNSKNALLDTVKVENSSRTGIFVNGSSVKLQNVTTMNNSEGGIAITRSRTLLGSGYSDSYVEVVGTITQKEPNINVNVKNLEMTDGYIQKNQFVYPSNTYDKYENDKEYKVLSEYYLNYFNIQGEERNKKYEEQDIDYMMIKQVIDVTKNTEVLDENGNHIQLVGDGVADETEKIEKLIKYAASNGRELYFPQGTYKITRDIDLSKIQLPALSNFKISGDKKGLSIFDGTSNTEKMLKLMYAEYSGAVNYVEIENIVFNNVGLEINGPYKKGIIIKNNTFMNGNYTREKRADGSISKATMEPYIMVKNNKYKIENNIFLRGTNYPGRGVATYRTKNTNINNNFFGDLDGADAAAKMLPPEVISRLAIIKSSNLVE